MSSKDIEFRREVQRNGEAYLVAQLQMALAADQRAVALGGIFAAAASVLIGFGVSAAHHGYIFLVMSGGLGAAALLAFWAARPIPFSIVGWAPQDWRDDLAAHQTLSVEVYDDIFRQIDERITKNEARLTKNGVYLQKSMIVAIITILIGVLLGLIATV